MEKTPLILEIGVEMPPDVVLEKGVHARDTITVLALPPSDDD